MLSKEGFLFNGSLFWFILELLVLGHVSHQTHLHPEPALLFFLENIIKATVKVMHILMHCDFSTGKTESLKTV